MEDYKETGLQLAVIANGSFQVHFHNIVEQHNLYDRVAVRNFDEDLSHLAYAGSDFILMPSSFEPCGLPQMVSPKYGSLPIVHNTGGIHDTVEPLDTTNHTGNGFRFDHFDTNALRWGIDQAMNFYRQSADFRAEQISRIMKEAEERFNHETTASSYISVYEKMLGRSVARVTA